MSLSFSLPLAGGGLDIPLPDEPWVAYAHFDYAASAPPLLAVQHAVAETLGTYGSVHRGAGYTSQLTTRRYERAREVIGASVGARADDAVIFTRNTTDALNLLAHVLPVDTTVVVFESEHHAALLPWERRHRAVRLPVPASLQEAVRVAGAALAARACRPRGCSWSRPRPTRPASCGRAGPGGPRARRPRRGRRGPAHPAPPGQPERA